jgi:quinolinate synthase
MNSAADLKDFVGRRGGAVCTSSNALAVMRWALAKSERVLFFPDQHLGRNTAVRLGMAPDDPVVWDPRLPMGGNDPERLLGSRVILWKGHCSVHQRFTVRQVENARRTIPGVSILVHPECAYEVVSIADHVGSTEQIIQTVRNAPEGSKWAIGTEIHLVHRIAKENPGKVVVTLDPVVCVCATMYRIDPAHLLWALENVEAGRPVNVIRVPPDVAEGARVALRRMLEIR